MSQFYYLASSKELHIGEYGSKPSQGNMRNSNDIKAINNKNCNKITKGVLLVEVIDLSKLHHDSIEYDTFEDAAGIFIKKLTRHKKRIAKHFKNPFIYEVSANFGNFIINKGLKNYDIDCYKANHKCISMLFEYIAEHICKDEVIEFYPCWADEEEFARNKDLDMVINLNEYSLPEEFEFKDKQYVIFRKNEVTATLE